MTKYKVTITTTEKKEPTVLFIEAAGMFDAIKKVHDSYCKMGDLFIEEAS